MISQRAYHIPTKQKAGLISLEPGLISQELSLKPGGGKNFRFLTDDCSLKIADDR